jgi:hypothetical protein
VPVHFVVASRRLNNGKSVKNYHIRTFKYWHIVLTFAKKKYMIQRIQTLYLTISIICLATISFGLVILNIEDKGYHGYISAYGKTVMTPENVIFFREGIPFFIAPVILILLCVWTMFSYKNLKFQLQLGRLTFLLYTVAIALLLLYSELAAPITRNVPTSYSLAPGFFIFIAGLPFIFLANSGIRKDKKLLDSLNRLR